MCGIVGIVGRSEEAERGRALERLGHRGPDGEGSWLSEDQGVWLGHRRLAIIDLEGGAQPLSNEDGKVWVTFNGCIYNYLEVAQSLRSKGHRFRSHSDTEVIVHAYEEWGEDCVKHFIGMFAFAIWDGHKNQLYCARDRIGVKPFYFRQGGGRFLFGSEIKALLATRSFEAESNPDALGEYLTFQTLLHDDTLFKGVKKLLPGHFMIVDHEGRVQKIKEYWNVRFEMDYDHTEEYFVDHLKLLLNDAIKIRLRSDVTLGAHLSGGMDSSAVVCVANDLKTTDDRLMTFTGGFRDGSDFDETHYAKLVSDHVNSVQKIAWPTAGDFHKEIENIIYYMDEPAAGPGVFPQYMVSKLASENVKVVLGGQAGDEIFAGYARYLIGYLEESLHGVIDGTDDPEHYAATLSTIIPSLPMLKQYIPMLKYFWADGLFEDQSSRYYRLMDRSSGIRDIYHGDLFERSGDIRKKFGDIFNGSDAESFLNRMLFFDLKVHLPALLHVEDRTSMAWGLESRIPLIDHRIVEFIAKIPPRIKFRGGEPKYIFKKAIKNIIPDEILYRKDKMGFPVPLHMWFKDELREFVLDTLLSKQARERGIFDPEKLEAAVTKEQNFGRLVWGALCLELWHKKFIDEKF